MSTLRSPSRSLASVDPLSPVNWDDPLNAGRTSWFLGLPSHSGGTTWRDLTARRYATLTDPDPSSPWVTSSMGWLASNLDGDSDYWTTDRTLLPSENASSDYWTFESWIRLEPSTDNETLWIQDNGAGAARTILYAHYEVTGGTVRLYRDLGQVFVSTRTIDDRQWHHLAVSRSGSTFRLYLDGTYETSGTSATAIPTQTRMLIGRREAGQYLAGHLASLATWNRALPQGSIGQLYVDGRSGFRRTLSRITRSFPAARVTPPPARAAGIVGGGLSL